MKLNKKVWLVATLLALSATVGAEPKPEDAVSYRKGMMRGLAWNIGEMGGMVKGAVPWDQKRFAFLAARNAALAPMAREGFTPGSAAAKSSAKPALWENLPDFDERNQALVDTSTKLAGAAQAGDAAASKQAFIDTTKVCKGCHDKYQEKH